MHCHALVSLTIIIIISPTSWAQVEPQKKWVSQGDEILQLVESNFYDSQRGKDWSLRHTGYSKAADSKQRFASLTNQVLRDLQASHTGYFTSDEQKYFGLLAIFAGPLKAGNVEYDSIGVDFTSDNYVRVIFAGSPGEKAGLLRGDRILQADGKEFHPVLAFRERAGQTVTLTVQRQLNQAPLQLQVSPRRINPKAEWLEAEQLGTRQVKHQGKSIAYVPLFSCAGEEYQNTLEELLSTKLRDSDALVLDIRHGFGGANPQMVNLFSTLPPVLTSIDRNGTRHRIETQWKKPLVVLMNEGTTSGKEVFAYAIKKHRLGTLVGQKSAGAVLAGRCFLLSDKSLLYLAASDVLVDNERLEGHGVEPDITVADNLTYAKGKDPQLEKAIEKAASLR